VRSVRRGLLCTGVAVLALAGACGNGGGTGTASSDPVAAAQAQLAKTKRATIDLRLAADAGKADAPSTKQVGFELQGPFALPEKDGALPVADLTSTRLLGEHQAKSTFVSTGQRAWVVTDGHAVELRGKQLDALRGTTKGGAADLDSLHLTKWFATRKESTSGDTTVVRGELDAVAAVNDVLAMAGSFGATGTKPIEGSDADRLRALVRSSSVELDTDSGDHHLRHLTFDVRFAPEKEPEVARLLPDLAGVGLHLELRLTDVGRAVHVSAPKGT
jgi:hypothetical protein